MQNSLTIDITPLIERLDKIEKAIEELRKEVKGEISNELINHDEACEYLNLSRVGLYKWRKDGKIPFYRIGSRVYFKKSELIAAMKKIDLSKYKLK